MLFTLIAAAANVAKLTPPDPFACKIWPDVADPELMATVPTAAA